MTHAARNLRFALPLLAAACVAACSDSPQADSQAEPSPSEAAATAAAVPGREFRYTSLDDCPLLRSAPEEAGFYEYECPGEGGFKLKLVEADLRQNIIVVPPGGGTEHSLDLAALSGGGFSELEDRVEWRGTQEGGTFTPDALILRQEVAEGPEGQEDTSYLVAVKLTGTPCVVARIEPGPGQNEQARAAADGAGSCLAGPG